MINFSWNSVLSELVDSSDRFPVDRIRTHGYEALDAACDMKGDLYDYIGHIKLVNGQVLSDGLLLDDPSIAASRRVDLHVQKHDEPVLKLCLWDQAAAEFWKKFKASAGAARVILVTTLNPKCYGVLSLSSMTPSRVFLDDDIQETRDYLSWFISNQEVANRIIADVVVKPENATLGELFTYMKKASAKVAWFECTATIDDVVHGTKWYYIGCGECHTKATRGPTTLMCKKCGKSEIVGVAQYLTKLSVYDNKDQAFLVLLGDTGEELFGKKAATLVENYYEANEDAGEDDIVPVPQVMIDTIGQTRKFIVKVSTHNLAGKTQTLTVTKVLPPEVLGVQAEEVGDEGDDHASGSVKRAADGDASEGVKRARSG
ncbi:replication protein A 70 kDa DNA-binding subunit A-like [Raphanus sativus]|uniref:Replication protein A 70 kDa DNA-binding subunit A-like n=1 Tax=Raphanus sativus TaxID=3726 RepID=A0A9W3CGU8_RAPSA|nr:replication protein A 70 kDa DNA-binding subunit A-like [Raphanus sativus]